MRSNPMLTWDMTLLTRRVRYWVIRGLYAALIGLVMAYVYQICFLDAWGRSTISQAAVFGSSFLGSYAFIQLIAVLVLTPNYVGHAVAAEKDRRTLDFLLMTDVGPAEIVLGKWAARAGNVFVLVLAGVPMLAMAQLFGSVSPTLVVVVTGVSLATVLGATSLTMWQSTVQRDAKGAVGGAGRLIFLFLIAAPLLWGGFTLGGAVALNYGYPELAAGVNEVYYAIEWPMWASNPFHILSQMLQVDGSWALDDLLRKTGFFVVFHLVATAVFLAWSVYRLRPAYLDQLGSGAGGQRADSATAEERAAAGIAEDATHWPTRRTVLPKAAADVLPVLVRDWTAPMKWRQVAGVALVGLLVGFVYYLLPLYTIWSWLVGWNDIPDGEDVASYLRVVTPFVVCITGLIVLQRASQSVGVERDRQSWLSLLVTPQSAAQLVGGKFLAALKPFLWTWLAMVPLWLWCWVAADSFTVLHLAWMTLVYWTFVAFCAMVGTHFGFRFEKSAWSNSMGMLTVVTLGFLAHALAAAVFGALTGLLVFASGGRPGEGYEQMMELLWSLWFGTNALAVIATATFSLDWFVDEPKMVPVVCLVFLTWLAYAAATAGLFRWTCRHFGHYTGRLEHGSHAEASRLPPVAPPPVPRRADLPDLPDPADPADASARRTPPPTPA